MIFQNLISGSNPYYISIYDSNSFSYPTHMHHEIEILYCMEGEFTVRINNKKYEISKGYAIVIGSMLSHEFLKTDSSHTVMIIEIGPILLRESFSAITSTNFRKKIYNVNEETSGFGTLLKEIAREHQDKERFSELFITGNLYKLFGYLLKDISNSSDNTSAMNYTSPTHKIEKALELIYSNYTDDIAVDQAAILCGYCKSNFCKIFKQITGVGFHQYLNNYRVRNAEYLLLETNSSIEQVANMVGFSDSKSFCRVFKSHTGVTPGQYRNKE